MCMEGEGLACISTLKEKSACASKTPWRKSALDTPQYPNIKIQGWGAQQVWALFLNFAFMRQCVRSV